MRKRNHGISLVTLPRLASLVLLPIVMLPLGCGEEALLVSESEAEELLEASWNPVEEWLETGRFQVVSNQAVSKASLLTRTITEDRYRDLRIWADADVLTFATDQDLGTEFRGWSDFQAQSMGIRRRIAIEPAEIGRKRGRLKKVEYSNNISSEFLVIPLGKYEIDEVISIKPIRVGVDDYSVVDGFLHRKITADKPLAEVYSRTTRDTADKRSSEHYSNTTRSQRNGCSIDTTSGRAMATSARLMSTTSFVIGVRRRAADTLWTV